MARGGSAMEDQEHQAWHTQSEVVWRRLAFKGEGNVGFSVLLFCLDLVAFLLQQRS